VAIAASLGRKFKSIKNVKASLRVFSALPMLAIGLVYRKQYLFVHFPLPYDILLNSKITIMEVLF
jgi:hypothetical protein